MEVYGDCGQLRFSRCEVEARQLFAENRFAMLDPISGTLSESAVETIIDTGISNARPTSQKDPMSSNRQQAKIAIEQIDFIPAGAALGAEVRGIDLRQLDDEGFAAIHQAWLDNLVLLFRGQDLTDAELIAFSRHFGDLDLAPIQENGRRFVDGLPELYVVSNVVENGEAIGSLGSGEAVWHTDMSYLPEPPKASVLYALEVPPTGGNTEFVNMYSVYDALPQELKDRIAGLRVKHDGTYNSGGYVRMGVTPGDDPREAPGTFHPLVCRHQETGRRMLYLGRRRNSYIEGFDLADSEALLDQLWGYAAREEFAWHNVWRPGDLVFWDNRCTMHRRDAFDAGTRRIMHRTQIKGQAPPAA
jgi:taurine dioxygenase